METRKRKPVADITNAYNLIPTSALRKLVAASSSNSNSVSKPPISILRSNSSSTTRKLCSDTSNGSDARSGTSISSSNISAARNPRTVQFRTPQRGISAIVSPGELGSKDAVHYHRQTVAKSNDEDDVVIVSTTPAGNRKAKGNTLTGISFRSPHAAFMKDDEGIIGNACNLLEKTKQKNKENFFGGVEKVKEFGKGIPNPSSCSYEKTEKQKLILKSAGCSTAKAEEIGKSIGNYSGSLLEKTIDKRKDVLKPSDLSVGRSKEIGKKLINSSSSFVEKTKEKERSLHPFDSSNEKTKEKGKAVLHHFDLDQTAKHKESSANCPPPRTKSEKRKHDSETFSCPPILRTKTMQNDLDDAENTKSSKSCTVPCPKCTKKRCPRIKGLSKAQQDEIEQLNKYFEELKNFELPEEIVSENESE